MRVSSTNAYMVSVLLLTAGYVWATFRPSAPFEGYAVAIVGLAGAYFAKRTIQKSEKYGGIRPNSVNQANGSQPLGD